MNHFINLIQWKYIYEQEYYSGNEWATKMAAWWDKKREKKIQWIAWNRWLTKIEWNRKNGAESQWQRVWVRISYSIAFDFSSYQDHFVRKKFKCVQMILYKCLFSKRKILLSCWHDRKLVHRIPVYNNKMEEKKTTKREEHNVDRISTSYTFRTHTETHTYLAIHNRIAILF